MEDVRAPYKNADPEEYSKLYSPPQEPWLNEKICAAYMKYLYLSEHGEQQERGHCKAQAHRYRNMLKSFNIDPDSIPKYNGEKELKVSYTYIS